MKISDAQETTGDPIGQRQNYALTGAVRDEASSS